MDIIQKITEELQVRENMVLAQEKEEKQLNELYKQMLGENDGEISYDTITKLAEFKKEIAKAITDMGVDTLETASASTMANNIRSIATSKNATSINYDNTTSGLASTDVQGAVDEINNKIDNIENTKIVYSTEEQEIGTWIDGKKLFRKCYTVTDVNINGSQIPHGISNLEEIIKIDGILFR